MSRTAISRVNCIVIAGEDAHRFAQTQFSGDVRTLAPGRWQWNAWLDPRGRVEALMQLANPGDGTLLAVLHGGDAERMHAGLSRYLLRARVTLASHAFSGNAGGPMEMGVVERAGPDLIIGCDDRSLRLNPAAADADPAAATPWRLADIRAGWPTLPTNGARFLPPALGLERLGALSFEKGCYPGQEIAARLHYRGGHKLRLLHVRGLAPLATGLVPSAPGAAPEYVLDSVAGDGAVDALLVSPQRTTLQINILENTYHVVSIFEP